MKNEEKVAATVNGAKGFVVSVDLNGRANFYREEQQDIVKVNPGNVRYLRNPHVLTKVLRNMKRR